MTGLIIRNLQDVGMSCSNKKGRINCGSISSRLRKILLKEAAAYHARGRSPGMQRKYTCISAMLYRKA